VENRIEIPWIYIRDGKKLPKEGQEILFVEDLRGTQEGYLSRLHNSAAILVKTKHGWVHKVWYEENIKEWWITVRSTPQWMGILCGFADHVTHWSPMPKPYEGPRLDFHAKHPYPKCIND